MHAHTFLRPVLTPSCGRLTLTPMLPFSDCFPWMLWTIVVYWTCSSAWWDWLENGWGLVGWEEVDFSHLITVFIDFQEVCNVHSSELKWGGDWGRNRDCRFQFLSERKERKGKESNRVESYLWNQFNWKCSHKSHADWGPQSSKRGLPLPQIRTCLWLLFDAGSTRPDKLNGFNENQHAMGPEWLRDSKEIGANSGICPHRCIST